MNTEQIVAAIRARFPEVLAIYLYGSFDTPYARPESDVDLGLLLPPRRSSDLAVRLHETRKALEEELSRTVDLVNLRSVGIILQNEVVTEGRLIFCGDQFETDLYEMHVLSIFQKHHEETEEIYREIMASGRVLP